MTQTRLDAHRDPVSHAASPPPAAAVPRSRAHGKVVTSVNSVSRRGAQVCYQDQTGVCLNRRITDAHVKYKPPCRLLPSMTDFQRRGVSKTGSGVNLTR